MPGTVMKKIIGEMDNSSETGMPDFWYKFTITCTDAPVNVKVSWKEIPRSVNNGINCGFLL